MTIPREIIEEDSKWQERSSEEQNDPDDQEGEDTVSEEIVATCERLRRNDHALVELHLEGNRRAVFAWATGKAVRAIRKALAVNTSLTNLNLRCNWFRALTGPSTRC